MTATKTLDNILAKTTKNLSNGNRKKAVESLQALYSEKKDARQVAHYLINLHYSVCQSFLEQFCPSASEESIMTVAVALINEDQFKNGNQNNFMYTKGLSAVLALASTGKYQASFLILSRILSGAEKADGFSDSFMGSFKKLITDKNGMPFIQNIFTGITKGEILYKEFEQKRLARFMKALNENSKETVTIPQKSTVLPPDFKSTHAPPAADTQKDHVSRYGQGYEKNSIESETITRIEKIQEEILVTLHGLSDNRSLIESLSSAITRRDADNSILKSELSKKEQEACSLISEIEVKAKQIKEMEDQTVDLTERLRTALQMDDLAKSQELITLKNDISEALKLDYTDFIKSQVNSYSEDLFEAYRSSLARVFKLLRRFGITCQ